MSIHARMTTMSFPLGEGQTFHFVFSNKTQHDGLCLGVREDLVAVGVSVWQQQTNIPKDSVNWFNEWYPNAIRALKIVCFISAEYLRSPYCMKEFGVALTTGNLLVVACEPIEQIMAVKAEVVRGENIHASTALAYLDTGGQVIFHGTEDTAKEILKFLPSAPAVEPEPQPEAHSLGPPPNQAAPKLSQIKTLAALSDATGETEADLLAYSDTDLEAVFTELQLSTVGKNKIRREVASLRQLVQQSEPPLAQPGLADAKPESPAQPAPQPKPCADQKMMTALAEWKASTPNWEVATELNLDDNQITDVAPLASLTALTKLYLYDNQITDRTPVTHLSAVIDWGSESEDY